MSKNDTTTPSIQAKLQQLDEVVAWFQGDDFELEQATDKLQQARTLAADIERDLDSVENEITIIKKSFASDAE